MIVVSLLNISKYLCRQWLQIGHWCSDWEIWHSSKNQNNILDIISLTSSFINISWKHIFRKSNFVTDAITSVGFSSLNALAWNHTILSTAIQALNFDRGATGFTQNVWPHDHDLLPQDRGATGSTQKRMGKKFPQETNNPICSSSSP